MTNEILDSKKVLETVDTLSMRIKDRFPNSDLYLVCKRLYEIGRETDCIIERIAQPNSWFRFFVGIFILLVLVGMIVAISHAKVSGMSGLGDWVQVFEAGLNSVVLLGAAIVFLVSVETRTKRKKVIEAVNRLRSLAHVIDSYQLTKDPDGLVSPAQKTKNSPKRNFSPYLLGRYLDYCSEMLSLAGKIGFLYVQAFHDPVSVNAVNDLENLTTGLARKIWQKIMILRTTNPIVQEPGKPVITGNEVQALMTPPGEDDYPGSALGLPKQN